ncbi:phenylacetate 2-hydroxylase [Aspergillus udagawae]|uniref:Phenylacetate 2-hydroxylase n=1 Tax=Aspergillus udagawae TaxID=91492 RepID=A0A8H3NKC3_9EURO|nr:phenylacetate 2-hydroxylase [Aspergillus udagawae]
MYAPNPDTTSTQTDIEKAKLARRQAEYAVLTDALRRGIPAIYIPFLVAAASAPREIPVPSADMCASARGGYAYASRDGNGVYPHLRGGYRVTR